MGLKAKPHRTALPILALACTLALALPAGAQAIQDAPTLGAPPTDLPQTWVAGFHVDKHVYHLKDKMTGTVNVTTDKCFIATPPCVTSIGWPMSATVDKNGLVGQVLNLHPVSGCDTAGRGAGSTTCVWSFDAPTDGWAVLGPSFGTPAGPAVSKDYFAVLDNSFILQGTVKDVAGKGLTGVELRLYGRKKGIFKTTTGAGGGYSAILPRDHYTVIPQDGLYQPASRNIVMNKDQTADFTLNPDHTVKLAFEPENVDANGFQSSLLTLTDIDARSQPVPDQKIQFGPPLTLDPRALVCGDSKRLWPSKIGSSVLGSPFERFTDGQGRYQFQVRAGTQPGSSWLLEGREPDGTALSEVDYKRLGFAGGGGGVPFDLSSELRLQNSQGLFHVSNGPASAGQIQNELLEWLSLLKSSSTVPKLNGADFAPINSTDSTGGRHAAILLYPHGTEITRLLNHFSSGGAIVAPPGTAVIDISAVTMATGAGKIPDTFPSLDTWEFGGSFPHGSAKAGRLEPAPEEDLTYFGYPYPPPAGTSDRTAFDMRCLRPNPNVFSATAHSPFNMLFRASNGKGVGIDAKGKLALDAPGVVVQDKAKRTRTIVVPAGSYTVEMTGTGKGAAAIEFSTPGSGSDTIRVFNFRSRKGGRGSVKLSGAGPSGAKFGGHGLHAQNGIGLRLRGLPKRLKAGKRKIAKVKVTDQFGRAVEGAVVTVTGKGFSAQSMTGRSGKATLALKVSRRGRLKAGVSAPGYSSLRSSISVGR